MKTTELLETQIEERDGATWVTGNCASCGTKMGIAADGPGAFPPHRCDGCGTMVVVELDRSKGSQRAERVHS
jgi:hypothetical protein